jgi:hypothetical protein
LIFRKNGFKVHSSDFFVMFWSSVTGKAQVTHLFFTYSWIFNPFTKDLEGTQWNFGRNSARGVPRCILQRAGPVGQTIEPGASRGSGEQTQ